MSSAFPFPHQTGLQDDRHPYENSSTVPLPEGQDNAGSGRLPVNLVPASHLSPYSSPNFRSLSASPPTSTTHTPAESIASLSVQQSVRDYQEQIQYLEFDPFVGASWDQTGLASPTFLQDNELMSSFGSRSVVDTVPNNNNNNNNPNPYPISPDTTPQLGATSPPHQVYQAAAPQGYFKNLANRGPSLSNPPAVAPQDLLTKRPSFPLNQQISYQLTPEASGGSGHSSDDDMAHSSSGLPVSPRVAVSYWDENNIARPVEPQADADSPTTHCHVKTEARFAPVVDDYNDDDDVEEEEEEDDDDAAEMHPASSPDIRRGIKPEDRPLQEVGASMNEMATRRKLEERNDEVRDWIEHTKEDRINPEDKPKIETEPNNIPSSDFHNGVKTENQLKEGHLYFDKSGGQVNDDDIRALKQSRNWADAPVVLSITEGDTNPCQPPTSQQAIEKYQRMADDVGSTISRAATWGTRPRSIAGMSQKEREDMNSNVLSGNILKKLAISSRSPAQFLQNMRRPSVSNILKRSKTDETERSVEDKNTLGVPRVSSWKKPNQVPSINTAIIAAGNTGMSITTNTGTAAGHGRSGSVSAASPKSPLGNLGAHIKKGRVRALSDFSRSSNDNPKYPHLVTMWRQQGGPPIAALGASTTLGPEDAESRPSSAAQTPAPVSARPPHSVLDDDDDDDDEECDDSEMMTDDKLIDDIEPNFAGFQKQVLKLNPSLQDRNNFLVDRIAYQQVVRYKGLLNNKVKHLTYVARQECSAGRLCIALGGSANVLDNKGGPRGLDPLCTGVGGSDGDITPLEGAINQDSFPLDIPMPPTCTLPAEFECQLCYSSKVFKKPSDWTKHVHEDVQPFTCTWDRCREPKIFKRKADWVRHENEGHRHLEWWTCDVDDCRHTCYRRDNFLQHLVREHKFPEPKLKTKAAIKKHGKSDPTWQKVERCHFDTEARPQDEPCRFCGKAFPTWKKLTVHLAKHMEQISLPILRLVAAKDLDADTIISPVQDPPPRPFPPAVIPQRQDVQVFSTMPVAHPQMNLNQGYHPGYTTVTPPEYTQQSFFNGFNSINSQVNQVDMTSMSGLSQPNPAHSISPAMSQQSMGQLPAQYPAVQVPVTASSYVNIQEDSFITGAATTSLEPFPSLTGPTLGGPSMVQGINGQAMGSRPMGAHPMNAQSLGNQNLNGLGLQAPANGHLTGYEYDPNVDMQQHFSSPHSHHSSVQGSVSPYGHSPHQGVGGFYSQ